MEGLWSEFLTILRVHLEVPLGARIPQNFPLIKVTLSQQEHPLTLFSRHMGRCIYGGIYDPGNALSDSNGYRTDVLSALRELDIPVIRYPGGNFVATYHWQDGIGPKDKRPARPELAWLGTETNEFGNSTLVTPTQNPH
jgi:alpha-L-arabinofuranosidase